MLYKQENFSRGFRPVAKFFTGSQCDPRRRWTKRDRRSKSLGAGGERDSVVWDCIMNVLKNMDTVFLKFCNFNFVIICQTVYVHKSQWREPFLSPEYYVFATENSRYAQRQRATKKKPNDPYLHLFQTQVDPSSQKRFRSRHKTKTTVTAITSSGGIITSLRFSLKIRIIVIYMKGLGVDWCMQNYQSRVALIGTSISCKQRKKLGTACHNYSRKSHTLSYG